jgi:ssDNA-binding Zn-finger/Zn-ribbon topoisomerase 1
LPDSFSIGSELIGSPEPSQQLPYLLRDDFLSPAELSFYKVLQLAVRGRATVLAKVNLADVFFVARPNENQSYRNKIDRKHVDFLLCDPATMKPRCGIELDDSSHARRDRQDRDEFVDQVFDVAELPLLRFPARANYDLNAIAHELTKCLGAEPVAKFAAVSLPPSGSPVCPKCNIAMVERVASKGPNQGKPFWGCRNYPRCREVA